MASSVYYGDSKIVIVYGQCLLDKQSFRVQFIVNGLGLR